MLKSVSFTAKKLIENPRMELKCLSDYDQTVNDKIKPEPGDIIKQENAIKSFGEVDRNYKGDYNNVPETPPKYYFVNSEKHENGSLMCSIIGENKRLSFLNLLSDCKFNNIPIKDITKVEHVDVYA